ncbi:Bud site selection protein, Revert to axial protein 1, partial [Linderina macrospora]
MAHSKLHRKHDTAAAAATAAVESEAAAGNLHVDTRPSLLDTATSLISPENARPPLNLAYSSSASSFFANHNNIAPAQHQSRHLERGLLQGQRSFEETVDKTTVTTSLLDPHPAIIPPPGSRLAFAGSGSRETTNMFRPLPSLDDMLTRKAKAPLCLFNYYQYLVDVEHGAQELQFWLALADYEETCRAYAGTLPPVPLNVYAPNSRQVMSPSALTDGRRISLVETSARILAMAPGDLRESEMSAEARRLTASNRISSAISNLDKDTQQLDNYLASLSHQTAVASAQTMCAQHDICRSDSVRCTRTAKAAGPQSGAKGFFRRLFSGESQSVDAEARPGADNTELPLLAPTNSINEPKGDLPTQAEIRRGAERLYFQYIQTNAPNELLLSSQMRDEISMRIERDGRIDPELFAPAKRHVYEVMRHESFPRFLRERIYHNMTRDTAAPRIALGLALIFVALTFQFSLIFLD